MCNHFEISPVSLGSLRGRLENARECLLGQARGKGSETRSFENMAEKRGDTEDEGIACLWCDLALDHAVE